MRAYPEVTIGHVLGAGIVAAILLGISLSGAARAGGARPGVAWTVAIGSFLGGAALMAVGLGLTSGRLRRASSRRGQALAAIGVGLGYTTYVMLKNPVSDEGLAAFMGFPAGITAMATIALAIKVRRKAASSSDGVEPPPSPRARS